MSAMNTGPLAQLKYSSGRLRTRYGGYHVDQYMIIKKEHGEGNIIENYRKKWKWHQ